MKIAGVDPSLTATGVADQFGAVHTIRAGERRGSPRLDFIRTAVTDLLQLEGDRPEIVMIEGYSRGSRNRREEMGELGGILRWTFWLYDTICVEAAPSTVKKFATGKGNADKDEVLSAAVRAGAPVTRNDEADAWWLRQVGCYTMDETALARTKYRDDATKAVQWPTWPLSEAA